MVSLRLFAIVLTTLICRELAEANPQLEWRSAALGMSGLTLGFGVLFRAFALTVLQKRATHTVELLKGGWTLQRTRHVIEVLWCLLLPATLLLTGWASWLNAQEVSGISQAFTMLGYFLPTFALVALIEITAAQFDALVIERTHELEGTQAIGYEPPRGRGSRWNIPQQHWCSHLLVRLRLGEFAGMITCVAPVFLISGMTDVVTVTSQWMWPAVADRSWANALGTGLALIILAITFPSLLSRLSQAKTIAGSRLAERIALFTSQLKLRGIEPLLISSHGRWAGAAVVGWFPLFRKLWLGDALVGQLSDRELDMVILHELAHVKRRHFLWRMLPVLVSSLVSFLAWNGVMWFRFEANWTIFVQLAICVIGGITLVHALGIAARRCELDADRTACQLARIVCDWSEDDCRMPGIELSSALSKLLEAPGMQAATWLHPSLKQRVEQLTSF